MHLKNALLSLVCVWAICTSAIFGQEDTTGCSVTFSVDPSSSNISISGSVVEPVTQPLQIDPSGVIVGFQGDLIANLTGPCPSDGQGLVMALAGAELKTTSLNGPLRMFPSNVTMKGGELVSVIWIGYSFNASMVLDDAESTNVALTVAGDSYTLSISLLTPEGQVVETLGLQGVQDAVTTDIIVNGNEVVITLLDLAVPFSAPYVQDLGLQQIDGLTNYTIAGSLVLKGAVGCGVDCGPYGRCAPLADGEGSACLCECGFSGMACEVPSGFCPQYAGEQVNSTAICPEVPASPEKNASESASDRVACVSGSALCSAFQEWDSQKGVCECKEDWSGPNCDVCESDAACTDFFSESSGESVSAFCEESRLYAENTALKAYYCNLAGTGLEDTIIPESFGVACNTTSGGLKSNVSSDAGSAEDLAIDDGSYCDVRFRMRNDPTNTVTCRAHLCSFTYGESLVRCRSVLCSCERSCPDIEGVLKDIEGKPCTVDCDEDNNCTFDIKDFFVKLIARCSNHDCRVDGYRFTEVAYDDSNAQNWDPVIALIPLFLVMISTLVLFAYTLTYWRMLTSPLRRSKTFTSGPRMPLRPQVPAKELSFANVCARIRTKNGPLDIVSNVSGVARSGELVGILGPSGSGKTSVLAVLAGAADDVGHNVRVEGDVQLDGARLSSERIRRVAYCAQESSLLPTLTVEECIRYSALLRMPPETSDCELQSAVEQVMWELGLSKVANSLIGGRSRIRGISGGERKRVSIAMELVTNPPVLLLDEPTSGLDSTTAYQLMRSLKAIAASGRIVLLSFHQPSPAMFHLLDRVMLLAQGRCVYTGDPLSANDYFANIGLPCPVGTGMAEHMLSCASDSDVLPVLLQSVSKAAMTERDELGTQDGRAVPRHSRVVSTASDEADFKTAAGSADTAAVNGVSQSSSDGENVSTDHQSMENGCSSMKGATSTSPKNRWWLRGPHEVGILFWRTGLDIVRNPILLILHWSVSLLMGIFVGCIFWKVDNDISGAQNRAGGLFFALAFFAFTSLTIVDLLIGERQLVVREVRGGYYNPSSYLFSKAVLDGFLLRGIPTLLYTSAFYPMMGLQSGALHVLLFIGTLSAFAIGIGALSLAVTVGCSTSGQVSLTMNLTLLISLLVGGFFVNVASIPGWIRWLHYLSPFYYAYSALISNEMSSLLLNFIVKGYTAVTNVRGSTFLEIIGVTMDVTTTLIVLDAMYVGFLVFAFVLLYIRIPRASWLSKRKIE